MINKASFRDVEFATTDTVIVEGRRVQFYEFINQSTFDYLDLGEKATRFQINAFVFGEDWQKKRDNLRAVLNQKGTGLLILPYLDNPLEVVVDGDVSIRENLNNSAEFSINFRIAKQNQEIVTNTLIVAKSKSLELGTKNSLILKALAEVKKIDTLIATKIIDVFSAVTKVVGQVKTIASTHESLDLIHSIFAGVEKNEGPYKALYKTPAALNVGLATASLSLLSCDFVNTDNHAKILTDYAKMWDLCEEVIDSSDYFEVHSTILATQGYLTTIKPTLTQIKIAKIDTPTPLFVLANYLDSSVEVIEELNSIPNPLFIMGMVKYY